MGYKRLDNSTPFKGVFIVTVGAKEFMLKLYDYERMNDSQDMLLFMDGVDENESFKSMYGSIVIDNSDLHELAKGKLVSFKTTKDFSGNIIRPSLSLRLKSKKGGDYTFEIIEENVNPFDLDIYATANGFTKKIKRDKTYLGYVYSNEKGKEIELVPRTNKKGDTFEEGGDVSYFSMSKTVNDNGHISSMVIAENVTIDDFEENFKNRGYEKVNDNSIVGFYYRKPNGDTIQLIPSFHKKGEVLKFKEGGDVDFPDKKSLKYFLLHQASSGMIANKTPYSDYDKLNGIRRTAIEILNREGDREYSLKSFSDIIQEALLEYDEKGGYFEEGGSITYSTPKEYLESLNLNKLPEESVKIIRDEILPDANLGLISMDNAKFKTLQSIIEESYPEALSSFEFEDEGDGDAKGGEGSEPKVSKKQVLLNKIDAFKIALEFEDDEAKIQILKDKIDAFEMALEFTDDEDTFATGGWLDYKDSDVIKVGTNIKFTKWDETRQGIVDEVLGDGEFSVSTDTGLSLVNNDNIISYK